MSRKSVSVMLVMVWVFLLTMVAPVMAYTKTLDQIMLETQYLCDQLDIFHATGRMSSDDIYGVYVDLSQISQNTVTAAVYQTNLQQMTLTTYTNIKAQPITGVNGAKDKLCRFFFYFRNNDRDNPMALWGSAPDDAVIGYVYGQRKSDILNSFVSGIPECLSNIRLYNDGTADLTSNDLWVEKYLNSATYPDQLQHHSDSGSSSTTTTAQSVVQPAATPTLLKPENQTSKVEFTPDNQTYIVNGETRQMDVKPYLKDGLLYVPVMFLAYSMGILDDGIQWNQDKQSVTIIKDDIKLLMTIGSKTMLVNGKPVIMNIAPEIKENRIMLPSELITRILEKPGN